MISCARNSGGSATSKLSSSTRTVRVPSLCSSSRTQVSAHLSPVVKALNSETRIGHVNPYLEVDKLDLEANVFVENVDPKETQLSLRRKFQVYGEILSIKVDLSEKSGVAYI